MIRFRSFLNSDPPGLAAIWRSLPANRARFATMTASILDDLVLSKPFFERRGLTVAVADDQLVGFAHAGFGPNATGADFDHSQGVICQLLLGPEHCTAEVACGLTEASADYLRGQGATTVVGGAVGRFAPFYLGLYGGSQLPGVLASDTAQVAAYELAGFQSRSVCTVLECDLSRFRPKIDRTAIQLRRQFELRWQVQAVPPNWWDAGQWSVLEASHVELVDTNADGRAGTATLWDMEPLSSSQGCQKVGIVVASVDADNERLLAHFVSEMLRDLASRNVVTAEVQVGPADTLLANACQQLGFQPVDRGLTWIRPD